MVWCEYQQGNILIRLWGTPSSFQLDEQFTVINFARRFRCILEAHEYFSIKSSVLTFFFQCVVLRAELFVFLFLKPNLYMCGHYVFWKNIQQDLLQHFREYSRKSQRFVVMQHARYFSCSSLTTGTNKTDNIETGWMPNILPRERGNKSNKYHENRTKTWNECRLEAANSPVV